MITKITAWIIRRTNRYPIFVFNWISKPISALNVKGVIFKSYWTKYSKYLKRIVHYTVFLRVIPVLCLHPKITKAYIKLIRLVAVHFNIYFKAFNLTWNTEIFYDFTIVHMHLETNFSSMFSIDVESALAIIHFSVMQVTFYSFDTTESIIIFLSELLISYCVSLLLWLWLAKLFILSSTLRHGGSVSFCLLRAIF